MFMILMMLFVHGLILAGPLAWQVTDTKCNLAQRIGRGVNSSLPLASASVYPAKVLFLSDSVDKHVMRFWCESSGGTVEQV